MRKRARTVGRAIKRWLLTCYQSTQILHKSGERAWPWNWYVVWDMARRDVDYVLAQQKVVEPNR